MLLIKTVSVIISLLAAAVFVLVFWNGIKKSNLEPSLRKWYQKLGLAGIGIWVIAIYILTLAGTFVHDQEDAFPKFLIGLFVPVIAVLLMFKSEHFRTILNAISFKDLALGQIWRMLGSLFFLIALWGIGPKAFMASGYGDATTGLIAILTLVAFLKSSKWFRPGLWMLTIIGTIDLLVVLFILLKHDPIWFKEFPNTAMAGAFPMMLIIGIAAPIALLLHIFTLRKLVLNPSKQMDPLKS
ncbi:hypothetical protein [Aestuariivivens sediminis]|uniref:hypothetical protein n=1 Tax=Aestuariivivens sediminis TaxID=2913557 RepID=UPI001F58EEF0|nr:hypothetical protein [Aestuariivivens sediminis]